MEETATPATVSMHAAPKKTAGKSPRQAAVPRAWIPRPAFVAIAFVLMLTVGWGAFHFWGRQSQPDEESELADLEAFEQEPPSLGAPDSNSNSDLGSQFSGSRFSRSDSSRALGENASPWQPVSNPDSNQLPALFARPDNPSARFQPSPFEPDGNPQSMSGAWLMGTIEADEPPQRISLPPRVTPTAADGPLFR